MTSPTFLAVCAAWLVAAQAAPIFFFGEDRDIRLSEGETKELADFPISKQARDDFHSMLGNVGSESFELPAFSVGDGKEDALAVEIGGAVVTLSGGRVSSETAFGQFPITGQQYYEADMRMFRITFSRPVAAFGFYGVDVGNVEGELVFTTLASNGAAAEIVVPHTRHSESGVAPSGGVMYFGFLDAEDPFVEVSFLNTAGANDHFAFDEFTVAMPDDVADASAQAGSEDAGHADEDEDEDGDDEASEHAVCSVGGIPNKEGTICCCGSCGSCGGTCGAVCAELPGGEASCCPGAIAEMGIQCILSTDCGCIIGEYGAAHAVMTTQEREGQASEAAAAADSDEGARLLRESIENC